MSSVPFVVAIPARYGATRLPGKPLRPIAGVPMVVHVAQRAIEAGAAQVIIATDDARIAQALADHPVTVCMTRADHASGSDRLAECAEQLGWSDATLVVNLQGDEPLAPASGVRRVAEALAAS
ncbi:MAG TPA: NTP transferase domain-containing protein, partial [Tahibacter sp.]|nr:NTP transferase domain-containing protein [Tahibacter sp.]